MTHLKHFATVAALMLSASGVVQAADTQQIDVKATVKQVCQFSAAGAIALAFTISPELTGNQSGSVDVPFKCTNGVTPTVATTSGGTTLTGTGTTPPTMAYTFSIGTVPSGAGFAAADTTFKVTATVADTEYRDAPAGDYTDTVMLSINP